MKHALYLAQAGRGKVHPNPLVGAVLVQCGEVVGRGWHLGPGEPHAEAMALAEAGALAGADPGALAGAADTEERAARPAATAAARANARAHVHSFLFIFVRLTLAVRKLQRGRYPRGSKQER